MFWTLLDYLNSTYPSFKFDNIEKYVKLFVEKSSEKLSFSTFKIAISPVLLVRKFSSRAQIKGLETSYKITLYNISCNKVPFINEKTINPFSVNILIQFKCAILHQKYMKYAGNKKKINIMHQKNF